MCVGFPKQDPLFLVYRQIYFTRSPVQCVFAKMYGVGVRLWTIWFLCHESSVQFHDMAMCTSTQKWDRAGNRDPLFALATCKQTALDTLEFALSSGRSAATLWCLTSGDTMRYTPTTRSWFSFPYKSLPRSPFLRFVGLVPVVRGGPPKIVPQTTGWDMVWLVTVVWSSRCIVGGTWTAGLQPAPIHKYACV